MNVRRSGSGLESRDVIPDVFLRDLIPGSESEYPDFRQISIENCSHFVDNCQNYCGIFGKYKGTHSFENAIDCPQEIRKNGASGLKFR
jgi:hypothetical protein